MNQIALDLLASAPPSLENYVAGRNAECLQSLRALAAGRRDQRFVYLWGAEGSGRTHLLSAVASRQGRLLSPASASASFAFDPACALYAVDDADRMDGARQQALFHLFNQVQASPGAALVSSGAQPPLALAMREDLRSRLGWGLVFELRLLDDADKESALRALAGLRGVAIAADVLPWLLTHRSRDIRVLLAEFDALDRYALERKRPITLALVREWLAQGGGQGPFGTSSRD
jgi:DnaA family protein